MDHRTKMNSVLVLLLAALALTVTPSARAQALLSGSGGQAYDSEFFIGPSFLLSNTVDYDHGTTVNMNNTVGFKIGGYYYLTDHVSIGGSYAYANPSFSANVASGTSAGLTTLENGNLHVNQFMFNARYHFLNGPLRPYILGGLGWNYTDSNVATGYSSGCWWDPWWGYYCGTYAHTKSTNGFTYQVGAGLEVNFTHNFAITAGYNETWIDWSHGGTPGFGSVDVMFTWRNTVH